MNAAVLFRRKVLDLAIRGKLTKREKGDDFIRKILDQVSFEKAERIAKKRNRKEKQLLPVSQEERPFEVPFEWEWRRLGEVLLPTETKLPVGKWFDYIDIDAIDNHQNVIVRAKHLETRDAPCRASRGVQFGDVLFSVVRPYLRNIVLVGKEFSHCIASTGFHVCRPSAALDSRFLFDVMLSDYVVNGLNAFMKGDNSPSINVDHIVNFPIPIPPLAEQKRIVERIDELFAAIDQYSTAMEKISNAANLMEQKVLDLAIRGKLSKQEKSDGSASEIIEAIAADKAKRVAKKQMRKEKVLPPITPDEQPFDLPEGWAWARLGQLVQLTSGQDLTPNRYNDNKKGIPYLTGASNIQDGNVIINRWTQTPTSCAEKGDLLFTCKGTVGRMAVLNEKKVHIARQIMGLKAWDGVNLTYIQYCLATMVAELQSIARSMIPGIGRDDLLNKVIPLPPLAEQKRIVERVDAILAECRKMTR